MIHLNVRSFEYLGSSAARQILRTGRSAFARRASFGKTAFAPLRLPSAAGAKRPSRSFAEGEAKAGWVFGTIFEPGSWRMPRNTESLRLTARRGDYSVLEVPHSLSHVFSTIRRARSLLK